ncbi:DUF6221 family protein [Streptomyces albidoflavus]
MSAQGEDILAWLDAAITAREALARAAEAQDPSPWRDVTSESSGPLDRPWGVGSGWVVSANDEGLWDCEGSGTLCMTADTGRFVAINDPASVLRRCATDRQLIREVRRTAQNARSRPWDPMYGPYADAMLAATKIIAESYGWAGNDQ